jgi:thiamine biosynthesis lipoprotein
MSGSDQSTAIAGQAIELLGDNRLRCRNASAKVDLGGIAKGFAVDRAVDVLRGRGVVHGVVNAGGDLALFGSAPEWVHIRNPKTAYETLCAVEIADAALASSGRVFDPHRWAEAGETAVFDPNTRGPVHAVAGATVRAPSCMIADALTKVVMIASEKAALLLQVYGASALLMLESGDVRITTDWQDAVRLAA